MFRHVVMFRWSDETTPADRASAVVALREWAGYARRYGEVSVGTDAGLPSANHDVVVVADFADRDAYQRYATDERHVALVRDHVAPRVSSRSAVQHEKD